MIAEMCKLRIYNFFNVLTELVISRAFISSYSILTQALWYLNYSC